MTLTYYSLGIFLGFLLGGIAPSQTESATPIGDISYMDHPLSSSNSNRCTPDTTIQLPKTIQDWTLQDATQTINAKTIFDYMDGAGELYVGYRFSHIDVYEYASDKQDNILVELYWMESSDDAFGLLSTDWGGEPVQLSKNETRDISFSQVPPHRALYGAGLLRLWADRCYARILTYNETPESREAVLDIGRAIFQNQHNPNPPAFLKVLPGSADTKWTLQSGEVCYLRSHLVLNSIYYLSSHNILQLDRNCEAVIASYKNPDEKEGKKIRLISVRFPDPDRAQQALARFQEAYLPEFSQKKVEKIDGIAYPIFQIEDGWTGYLRIERDLVIVFESHDQQTVQTILHEMESQIKSLE